MALIEVVLVGSAIGAATQTYKKRHKKELMKWRQTHQRQKDQLQETSYSESTKHFVLSRLDWYPSLQQVYERVKLLSGKHQPKRFLVPVTKLNKSLLSIALTNKKAGIIQSEKDANWDIILSIASLGFASAGWIYPPLLLGSMIGLICFTIPRYKAAYLELLTERRVTVNLLDAVILTCLFSTRFYFIGSVGCIIASTSRKLLAQTKDHSQKSLINIFGEQPRTVWRLIQGVEIETPLEDLQKDDVVAVYAGQTIPVDGTIVGGMASIDQQRLTGEAQPAEKGVDEPVFAATVVLSGTIYVQVEKAGEETHVAQIGQILHRTADFKLQMQSKGEALADGSVLPNLAVGALALPILGVSGAMATIYCPFGWFIRLTGPLSLLNFLRILSRKQVLVKDARSLELLSQVDTVVFDKTGTLTAEQPHVGRIHTRPGLSEDELLQYAATAEWKQTHPIARAILQEAASRGLGLYPVEEAHYEVGYGIKVKLSDKVIRVGSHRFMKMEGIKVSPGMLDLYDVCAQQGHTFVMVALNHELVGGIELHTTVRPEMKTVVRELHRLHKTLYIISGDHETPTRFLANELGIDQYIANALPGQKAELIDQLIRAGKSVCFVGDGINDTLALSKATVSVSLAGATTAATDIAQIVLMDGNLERLPDLFDIAREMEVNMRNNFMLSLAPSMVCVAGAFLLHFGLATSALIFFTGLFANVSNSMKPLFNHRHGVRTTRLQ